MFAAINRDRKDHMKDENLEEKSSKTARAAKNKSTGKELPADAEQPRVFDKDAAHRKVMMVMVGLFLAILALMLLLEKHVEFASSGGM